MTPCVPAYQEIRISVLPLSATVVGSLSVMALKTTSFVKKEFWISSIYRNGQTNYDKKHRKIESHVKDVRFSFVKFYAVFCEPVRLLS